ncbi:MAG: hypothetical protein IT381_12575 [Deltaproteobacteria bacterium]|nr:hypothetical protein [Deltaproteobacteria bacterium]
MPGQSGNPGGRPKRTAYLRELALQHTDRAIAVLAESLEDDDARVRIAAANSILDRAYGKPGHAEGEADEARRRELVLQRDLKAAATMSTEELRAIAASDAHDD